MAITAAQLVPDILAIAACGAAAVIDARRYRIPNWLTASAAMLGLAVNAGLGGVDGLLMALAGGGVALAVVGAFASLGLIGMGDVKLAAAAGALIRWPLIGPALLYTALAGGGLALVLAIRRRRRAGDRRMPYGMAIATGVIWAVCSRYLPEVTLI